MDQRAAILRERFDIPAMTGKGLRNYYLRAGIRYTKPNYKFWKLNAELIDLKPKQMEFVKDLGTIMQGNYYDEVIYVDETTFNLWQKTSKAWLRGGMKLSLPPVRGPGITMIGAISDKRGLIHLEIFHGSNNSDLFMMFLAKLKEKCQNKRVVVVLDNLKIHESKKLEAIYDSNIKEMRLPP
jgi:hypothetical protein